MDKPARINLSCKALESQFIFETFLNSSSSQLVLSQDDHVVAPPTLTIAPLGSLMSMLAILSRISQHKCNNQEILTPINNNNILNNQ